MTIERRFIGKAELRAAAESRTITGHAAVFDSRTELFPAIMGLPAIHEEIAPGAFAESVGQDDIRALFNHDPNFVIGRNRSGTLEVAEDRTGLKFEAQAPDTQWARDLLVSMDRGDITGASFGFRAQAVTWSTEEEGAVEVRRITKAQLFDVSPVTYPAYEAAYAEARSMDRKTLMEERARLMAERRAETDGDQAASGGTPVPCPECKVNVPEGAVFCPACGCKVAEGVGARSDELAHYHRSLRLRASRVAP
jgi:uncharacterized protein